MFQTNAKPLAIGAVVALSPAGAAADNLQPSAEATRSIYWNDVYQLTVYDEDGRLSAQELRPMDAPIKVEIKVLHDGDLPDIPESWTSELVPAVSSDTLSDIEEAYRSLNQDDVITVTFRPGIGTRIKLNDRLVVETKTAELALATVDIWLGDTPVSEDFKAELLGN